MHALAFCAASVALALGVARAEDAATLRALAWPCAWRTKLQRILVVDQRARSGVLGLAVEHSGCTMLRLSNALLAQSLKRGAYKPDATAKP